MKRHSSKRTDDMLLTLVNGVSFIEADRDLRSFNGVACLVDRAPIPHP